jgi:hypothetical protein
VAINLDDLDSTPLNDERPPTPDAKRYLALADEMLDDPKYTFAESTVRRMYDWVKANGVITTQMMTALDNIHRSVADREELGRGRGGSRRYEGYGGGGGGGRRGRW